MSAKINHGLYRLLATGRRTRGVGAGGEKRRKRGRGCAEGGKRSSDKKIEYDVKFFSSYRRAVRARACNGARYTCGLLNSGRFEFISSAAKPLSMRVGLAVLGPGVVITPGQEGREERSGNSDVTKRKIERESERQAERMRYKERR